MNHRLGGGTVDEFQWLEFGKDWDHKKEG